MDGVHDLGGVEGFGPLRIDADEAPFPHEWEGRVMAMRLLMGFWGAWNTDRGRHSIERLPPVDYLSMTYYEKWLASLVNLSVETGFVTGDEVATGTADPGVDPVEGAPDAAVVRKVFPRGGPSLRAVDDPPRFRVGDAVRTREHMHSGHTRLPGYARGRVGEITSDHGAHVLPDSNAAGEGEQPEHLYTVRFRARELWGDGGGDHAVHLDLWESYLAPAG
ncbi:MAG: nitrile hydratase subunit beta [Actinomycetota bacterium]